MHFQELQSMWKPWGILGLTGCSRAGSSVCTCIESITENQVILILALCIPLFGLCDSFAMHTLPIVDECRNGLLLGFFRIYMIQIYVYSTNHCQGLPTAVIVGSLQKIGQYTRFLFFWDWLLMRLLWFGKIFVLYIICWCVHVCTSLMARTATCWYLFPIFGFDVFILWVFELGPSGLCPQWFGLPSFVAHGALGATCTSETPHLAGQRQDV